MKRLLLLATMLAFASTVDAQFKMKNSAATISKNSTVTSLGKPEGNVEDLSVQLTVTKNSGTGGAKCYLRASDDLVGWKILPDSLTINSSTTYPVAKIWDLGPKRYYYYQTVVVTDTFTQVLVPTSHFHTQAKGPDH